ncbi:unnamed protein product [Rotaria sordida]|uniref:Uncharacterized protein n=1 Tax=Rotaria sordida TaxID=392033 RepID=A0A819C618_9BILA|nr:unnamed protein product [Rotaria sordida]CAF3941032.1 unnamed protein product [Rotaria sordida]
MFINDNLLNSSIITIEINKEYYNVIEKTDVELQRLKQVIEGQEDSQIKKAFEAIEVTQIRASSITLCIGEIYQLNIELETLLEQLGCTISEINLSSSSNSTSTSCISLQKQQENQSKEKRRPCLSWRIKRNGVEELPIATFEGRDLKTPDKTTHTTLSTEFLLKHVLSIYPRKSPANKKL